MNVDFTPYRNFSDPGAKLNTPDDDGSPENGFNHDDIQDLRPLLENLATRKLGSRFSSMIDAEDIVQSAIRTLIRRNNEGLCDDYEINSANDLKNLLAVITTRKALQYIRKTLPELDRRADSSQLEAIAQTLGPVVDVECSNLLENASQELSAECVTILELRVQEHSIKEISAKLKMPVRTVNRRLSAIRKWLEKRAKRESED